MAFSGTQNRFFCQTALREIVIFGENTIVLKRYANRIISRRSASTISETLKRCCAVPVRTINIRVSHDIHDRMMYRMHDTAVYLIPLSTTA